MYKSWLGIDVSKDKLDVVLLQSEYRLSGTFENSDAGCKKLLGWLAHQQPVELHACLEATGQYSLLAAQYLFQAGYCVSVVNPLRIKAYGESRLTRNKTDRLDAFVIADFCRKQNPFLWKPPSPAIQELQALVRYLDDLKSMRVQENNRLTSGVRSATVIQMLQEHIVILDQQIQAVQNKIRDCINQHPELKQQKDLLYSIPGIGDLTAARLLAEIQDITVFENASQLAAYAGVTPRQHSSGSSVRHKSRQSKTGNAHLRKALYFPAIVARKHNPIIRLHCQRLEERGKLPKVIIAASMRKLLHIAFGVLKSGKPFDPNFLSQSVVRA
jgi:transposase